MEQAPIPTAEDLRQLLAEIATMNMPYGMYGPKNYPPDGCPLMDLPTEYLDWFWQRGWPKGKLGRLLEQTLLIKNSGLDNLTTALYEKALKNREDRTFSAENLDELKKIADENNGYIKAMWCGDLECEMKLKEEADVSSRCMPFGMDAIGDKCVCCGREAKKLVYWGKAY